MQLVVVTSCTGEKAVNPPNRLTLDDFRSPVQRARREEELAAWRMPAGELYTGDQHTYLMEGVRLLRKRFDSDVVHVRIISAGYGVVTENQPLAPYEATFNNMTAHQAREWARDLQIPEYVRLAISGYSLVIFLLGDTYLKAIEPPIVPARMQRLIYLAKPSLAPSLVRPGVTVVPAGKEEAGVYHAGLVALKGQMFRLFAQSLAEQGKQLFDALLWDETPETFLRSLHREVEAG